MGAAPGSTDGDTARWETIDEPVEELPPSIAEPVSAPPASRRDFTPIVIEGTVIEARDLTEPEPVWSAQPTGPVRAEPAEGGPWAGTADPTMPVSVDPPVADDTVSLAEPAPTHLGAPDRSAEPDEPTVSLASASEPTTSLFESPPQAAEPTTSLFEPPAPAAEATAPLLASSSAEPTVSLFDRVPAEPTAPLSHPAEGEPTVSLASASGADHVTVRRVVLGG
ncbi:hypothetical protein V2I01_16090 [Micromonospora sp. BRA006-A]|nr:hypothetical protein [Micromonospora sp. BRA006-A]